MKKFAWIIALLAALSLGFFSCAEPDGSSYRPAEVEAPTTAWTVIFDLQDASNGTVTHGIQALPVGALNMVDGGANPLAPIRRAGQNGEEIVEVGGKKAIKYTTTASWGPGLDLDYSAFGYKAGDKITIVGTAAGSAIDLALNYNQGAAQQIVGSRITAAGAFTIEATLTAAHVTTIQGNEQKTIRFEDRAGSTTVTITQIKIEGERSIAAPTPLTAPVIALTATGVSWTAVEGAGGYRVYAEEADPKLIASPAAAATSVNIQAIAALQPGDYTITVVAVGVVGASIDSVPSNSVTFTKTGVPTIYQVPAGGATFFHVNLNDYQTAGNSSAGSPVVPNGTLTANNLTLVFTENNQRANFKLTAAQAALVYAADSLKITVTGTATPDNLFRYHIGDAAAGSAWNATTGNGGQGAAFSTITGEQVATFGDNKSETTTTFFILNHRETTETTSVVITSIKIELVGALPPPAFGPQPDGSYKLDPAGWKVWYGATVNENAVSFTGGAVYIQYPDDFDITDYSSVTFVYSTVIDDVGADANGGKGAKVTLKVLSGTPGGSYNGTDVAYLGPLGASSNPANGGAGTLTVNDGTLYNKSWADDVQGAAGVWGFAIAENNNDTSDKFTITFESIIFNP